MSSVQMIKEQDVVGECIMRILVIRTARQIPVGRSDQLGWMDGHVASMRAKDLQAFCLEA